MHADTASCIPPGPGSGWVSRAMMKPAARLDSPGKALSLRARLTPPPPLFPDNMANTKSAAKRTRQSAVRTARNKASRTRVKNSRRAAAEAVKAGAKDSGANVAAAASAADKAANRGVIHKNKASRIKARLAKAAKAATAK